ncbi:transcriptional regulator [Thalassotalea euphylliae]|uniref:Transcriptional regulator n=1 Tax=Thalassotalea euphylliae TaxID=1655234 RepID=A0A3E0TPU8_9GAMM|nr:helix-turn-helix domain-containing protein [Thalassotalea euphylliae]REL26350.1 transcriptional regulator [Thalassotalea euphylliae]
MTDVTSIPLILNATISSDLDVIGDRWTLLILRDLFLGRTRFESLRTHTGASKATLSRRLDTLIQIDVIKRQQLKPTSKHYDYLLTGKGLKLFGASILAWRWETQWLASASESSLPITLLHTPCGHPFIPETVCTHCGQAVKFEDVKWYTSDDSFQHQLKVIQSANKMRRVRNSRTSALDNRMAGISDLIGDRWTLLILIAAFMGAKRNYEFANYLNIASNILSQRLSMLVEENLFEKTAYQHNPPRYEYVLTDKSKALFPLVMILRQWAMDFHTTPESLKHEPCGANLRLSVNCNMCKTELHPTDISF